MSISTRWLDQTTILQTFKRTWTPEEFETQYATVARWVESVEHEVNLILDLQQLDLRVASNHLTEHKTFPKKLHSVVVVNEDNIVMKALLPLVQRMTPPTKKSPIVIVKDMQDAYEVLSLQPHTAA